MNPKTLYTVFSFSIKHRHHTELNQLRPLVQEITGVHERMPDRTLADILRRRLFSERIQIPADIEIKTEQVLVDIFGEEYEDLFTL